MESPTSSTLRLLQAWRGLLGTATIACFAFQPAFADVAAISNKPEIVVEQPAGQNLVDGKAKRSFGTVVVGKASKSKTITIRNIGSANLSGLFVTRAGKNSADFVIGPLAVASLESGGTAIFKVQFKPTAKGTRTAIIRIKSNDANENPFDITVSGAGA